MLKTINILAIFRSAWKPVLIIPLLRSLSSKNISIAVLLILSGILFGSRLSLAADQTITCNGGTVTASASGTNQVNVPCVNTEIGWNAGNLTSAGAGDWTANNRNIGVFNGSVGSFTNSSSTTLIATNFSNIAGSGSPSRSIVSIVNNGNMYADNEISINLSQTNVGSIINNGNIRAREGINARAFSIINLFENNGRIDANRTSTDAYGIRIQSGGRIAEIRNFGVIKALGSGGYDITNQTSNGIGVLINAQGSRSNFSGDAALTFNSNLPSVYQAVVNSANYGKLAVAGAVAPSPGATMTFGIYSGSTVLASTYVDVLTGVGANLLNNTTGTSTVLNLTDFNWFLTQTVSGSWNLTIAGGTSNIQTGITTDATALSGNPTLSGGTLVMNVGGDYNQNFTVSNSTTSTIDQDGNTSIFTGIFSGGGDLVISNTGNGGKIIFSGTNNTYSGTTTVTNGADVAVNGSMLSSFVVTSGGILQGNGSFGGGSINSGGILAPGNSIGTITSNGALTFASGSTYQVEVNSAGQSDKIIVNDVATLQGGTVSVSGTLPSTPVSLLNTKYSILTATNGVSGKFDSLSLGLGYSFLTPTLYYGSNDVTLGFALTPFSTVSKNINQRNVGNALTIAALGPVNSLGAPILDALFSGNYDNAQAVMDTVGGSGLAGVQSTAMQVGEMASSSISDQIAFWRSGETMDATGRTSQEGNNPRNFLAYAQTETKVPNRGLINLKGPTGSLTALVAPRTFRAWGSMFGGGANYLSDAGRGAAASNIGYYGGLIGVDYQIQPNILVGVALGGSSSSFNVGSLSTNGNLTGFHAGVYGAYTIGNSYIALNETFSAYNNQTSRKAGGYSYLPYEQLSAQFSSTEFRTRAELGHGVLMGGLKATPFIAAEIAAYQSNAFSEQSSIYASTFALKNNGQGVNSLPTFAGLRLSNAVTLSNGWRLAPVGSVAYVHEFFPQRQLNNMLISMPGTDFNVAGPRSTYNLVQTKIGAQLNLNEKLALFTDFQGEFSPVSQSYGGKGGVKYVW